MELITHEELVQEFIGPEGTPNRNRYELELRKEKASYRIKIIRVSNGIQHQTIAKSLGLPLQTVIRAEFSSLTLPEKTLNRILNNLSSINKA